MKRVRAKQWVMVGLTVLILAALACSAPGAQQPDAAATVAAVYATITQQANLPPLTRTAMAADSATLQPTTTQSAPATATPPDARGPVTVIHNCPGVMAIDTRRNDWPGDAASLNIDQINYNPNQEWTGPTDLSGTVRLCWTEGALFLLVDVTDDVHFQTQRGGDSYKGDEVELMYDYDLRGDFAKTQWDDDDSQLSLNPGEFGVLVPEPYRYRPQPGPVQGITMDARRNFGADGEGYFLEAEISWGVLGGKPVNAQNYGLCIAFSDADHPENPPAEDTLASTCPGLAVSNPTTWRTVTFYSP